MRWADVQHQERALSLLRRALRSGRAAHAYLFEGPEGVGKETAARVLAARLLCQAADLEPDADPCGTCEACRLLERGNHPDFHLIHRGLHKQHPDRTIRAGKGLFLVVDLIRHFLIEPAGRTPALGPRRVFLVREAERMNEQAQNALLKTLEEPPGQTSLILVTSAAERLLPTIRSRCQRIPFDLLPREFVARRLASAHGVPAEEASALARLADGRLGAALRWHRINLLAALEETAEYLRGLPAGGPVTFAAGLLESATALAERSRQAPDSPDDEPDMADDEPEPRTGRGEPGTDELRAALKLVLTLVGALLRDALVERVAPDTPRHLPSQARLTRWLAENQSPESLQTGIRAVAEAETMLDQNVAPQLACERLGVVLLGSVPTV